MWLSFSVFCDTQSGTKAIVVYLEEGEFDPDRPVVPLSISPKEKINELLLVSYENLLPISHSP
jgi:hypothetical protein